MLSKYIKYLVEYGIQTGLTPECERIYTTNLLLDLFQENNYEEVEIGSDKMELEDILQGLLKIAVERGLIVDSIVYRDLFDTKIMNCLIPRPAQIQEEFSKRYQVSPKEATDYYYKLSQDSDYIRRYRICKDRKWKVESPYGGIDITINLSKPEKDPKAIAAAKNAKASSYPKCLLCVENEGYAGHVNHPARENHRIIPITVNDSAWGFQYSPYVYYNEHCIVFNGQHTPMKIEKATFAKLFDFVKLFPHYFLGSNADLPIVGGSILSHDHFQGGNYTFAMAKAPMEERFVIQGFQDVEMGIVKWPLSVLRLRGTDEKRLIELGDHILQAWRGYTDEEAFVYAETNGEPHNTITPIARKVGDIFELDLALRNNITTPEHPLGVYHPHAKRHHIKKENIGLIEVMGLAVLPARLKEEMELLAEYIVENKDIRGNAKIQKHADWAETFVTKYDSIHKDNIMEILEKEVGIVFTQVLEDAGVFKCTEEGRAAFRRFIRTLSEKPVTVVKDFGTNTKGEAATLYSFENSNGMKMEVSDFGATLYSLYVPDAKGELYDVVLGYDDPKGYEGPSGTFFGATVGRNANRIGKASFVLNGKEYKIDKNDGNNNLHSGLDFYSFRIWDVKEIGSNHITFALHSPDMDQGYPGALDVEVTYTLTENNEIRIDYYGVPEEDTIVNLTNHSYFNLNGHASGSICKHEVWVDADAFTRADAQSIPTGEITPVESTPMDFRVKKPVGKDIEEPYEALIFGKGYDHNWALNNHGAFAKVAEMTADVTGITMEVYTDLPGVQIYSGNFLTEEPGKAGVVYKHRQGICFETQFFPDAVNHNNFQSSVCKAGEIYRTTTVYKFK